MNRRERRAIDKIRRRDMKINFSQEVVYIPEWNGNAKLPKGEQVSVTLKPLNTSDLILLMEAMGKKEDGSLHMMQGFLKEAPEIFNKYVTLNGLYNGDAPVTNEDLCNVPYFLELTAEILGQLATISMPNEGEEKNSQKQPD